MDRPGLSRRAPWSPGPRRRPWRWPVSLNLSVSRPYSIWDRRWRTPLVASLRGQTLPFENVLAKGQVLHYHFAGDVHAAMVQSLSFGVIHSSLALSVAHDVLFGLTGATITLLFAGFGGARGALLGPPVAVASLLAGPLTLGRDPSLPHTDGYSVLNALTMSFRPHDALAYLFYLGFVGAVLARIWRRPEGQAPPLVDTAPPLFSSALGLAISDETSLGLLGLSLGLVWLLYPEVVHPRRGVGASMFLGLLLCLLAPNLAFSAALAPGSQRHTLGLAPWRSPGCYTPVLPLSTPEGRRMLLFDALPTVLAWAGAACSALAWRRPRMRPILSLLTALLCLSLLALTRIDVNHNGTESHRFMTLVIFLMPFMSASSLLRRPDDLQKAPGDAPLGRLARLGRAAAAVLIFSGAGLGAASTVDWIREVAPRRGHRHTYFFTNEDLYALDCRRDLGATLDEAARPHYLSKSLWYAYAGCQPTFAPGRSDNDWKLTIGNPVFGREAIRDLEGFMGPGELLPVICPRRAPGRGDPICAWAAANARCEPRGARVLRCELDAAGRAALRGLAGLNPAFAGDSRRRRREGAADR